MSKIQEKTTEKGPSRLIAVVASEQKFKKFVKEAPQIDDLPTKYVLISSMGDLFGKRYHDYLVLDLNNTSLSKKDHLFDWLRQNTQANNPDITYEDILSTENLSMN